MRFYMVFNVMGEVLAGAGFVVVVVTAVGLFQVLRSGIAAERMMAVQLLSTGGSSALLLIGTASNASGITDVALLLTLFAAFSCAAFALGAVVPHARDYEQEEDRT